MITPQQQKLHNLSWGMVQKWVSSINIELDLLFLIEGYNYTISGEYYHYLQK